MFPKERYGVVVPVLIAGLGRWIKDATWERIKASLLGAAELAGKIDWTRASVDGSFSPGEGRGRRCGVRVQG